MQLGPASLMQVLRFLNRLGLSRSRRTARGALAWFAGASLLVLVLAGPAGGQGPRTLSAQLKLTSNTHAGCYSRQAKGFARCFAVVRTPASHEITPDASAPPSTALGPADIQAAYNLPSTGAGQTVAIVDAFGDSSAESDLAVFRSQYGLPPCTTANGCFTKVNQVGQQGSYPPDDAGWALETSLDLDAVSAACPACNILLVESNTNTLDDMGAAVDEAVSLGAKYVSNSYGTAEFDGEQSFDHYYDHPGVVVTASSGDAGNATSWPSTDPNVVAVGGTSLSRDSSVSRGWDESAWGSGGSGCSPFEPHPDYQNLIATDCSNNRATADVSADADPASGLATYDTLGYGGWLQVGGTSLSSPLLAAMYALAGAPVANTYPVTDPYHDPSQASDLFDITQGSNGSCGNLLCQAGPGWDGPTGLGTPDGVKALQGAPQGTISGQVTDAATGAPLADAIVTAKPGGYSTRTDASGDYTLDVAVGSYDLSASIYAYQTATQSGVQVTEGQSTTVNLALTSLPKATLSGVVSDGSGHGWPLYAEITIDGYPNGPIYTNPYTGHYSVLLASGTYTVHVVPAYPAVLNNPGEGYQQLDQQVTVGSSDSSQNFAVRVDKTACTAPGYGWNGQSENFTSWTGATPRDGWTVTGTSQGWRFDDPANRPPPGVIRPGFVRDPSTQGDNRFAVADSANAGSSVMDTTLVSPRFSLAGQTAPLLSFVSGYYAAPAQGSETAEVDLSLNGGRTWTAIWQRSDSDVVGKVDIPIPQAAGHSSVRVRFHFNASGGWYWAVDNVFVGTRTCVPIPGGLVAGLVSDQSTGQPLNSSTVTSVDHATDLGISSGSSDAALPAGFYMLFSSLTGGHLFTATAAGYSADTADVNVSANQVTHQDWALSPSAAASTSTGSGATVADSTAVDQSVAAAPGPAIQRVGSGGSGTALPAADNVLAAPGRQQKASTVTLITGDQVRLSPGPGGRSVVTTVAAPRPYGASPSLQIIGAGGPSVYAIPADVAALIIGHRIDANLFNVRYLAADGDTGRGGATLPVVLRYAGHLSASELASRASELPDARVRATHPAAGTVEVGVDTKHAAAFWAALTSGRAPEELAPARAGGQVTSTRLAGGIAQVWLAGHQTAASAQPQQQAAGAPLYTLTETIYGPPNQGSDPANYCGPNGSFNFPATTSPITVCWYMPALFGIVGNGVESVFGFDQDLSYTCLDINPCDTLQIQIRLPAGVYYHTGDGGFRSNSFYNWFEVEDPQITVAGDTQLTYHIGQFQRVSVKTPQPTLVSDMEFGASHTLPDGVNYSDMAFYHGYGDGDLWVAPSSQPATVSKFATSESYALIQPPVNMSVTAPQSLNLTPFYPSDNSSPLAFPQPPQDVGQSVRFSGTHTYQLVDAGDGAHVGDFNHARGKLALVQLTATGHEDIEQSQLENALKAGAVGVVVDPYLSLGLNSQIAQLPVQPSWWDTQFPDQTPVQIPFVSIPRSQADTLRQMLRLGPVDITVTDNGQSPYLYDLKFLQQGQVPATADALRFTPSASQLATITTRYHSVPGQPPGAAGDQNSFGAWATNENFIGGVVSQEFGSGTIQQSYLVSPDEAQEETVIAQTDSANDRTQGLNDRIFAQPGASLTEDYFDPPAALGSPLLPTDVFAAWPGFDDGWPLHGGHYASCAFCRQGSAFYPLAQRVEGSSPRELGAPVFFTDPSTIHLYSGGQEIPPGTTFGLISYQLPPQQAQYRLVADDGISQSTWNFTSAEPVSDTRPEGTACLGDGLSFPNLGPPCAPVPLIFLRYDAGLSLDNTVTAPGDHQLNVVAYHQAADAPAITGLKLWTSTDGGTSWQQATVTAGPNADFTADYTVPALSATKGYVSIKAQAQDAAGNDITQTTLNAFGLASP
jgi:Carboxypeptidase regulatory-like domain